VPYLAPGLVGPDKAARGKLPTDVWWHTIVSPTGREKTGYPTQKPEGVLRRVLQPSSRPGDRVLDFFAGSGTTGAVAAALGRRFVLVDANPEAVVVMRARLGEGPTYLDEDGRTLGVLAYARAWPSAARWGRLPPGGAPRAVEPLRRHRRPTTPC
jgi:site-specific DNA-methyltransferase (adenine-specific)